MFFIGIDIGTNSTRAALFDDTGRMVSFHACAYTIDHPAPGHAEQDAHTCWRKSVIQAVRAILPEHPKSVLALSVSTQGGSTLAVDGHGEPLCPAISWMDARSQAQAESLRQIVSDGAWLSDTGILPSPHYSLCQLAWLRDNQPETFQRAARFVTTIDYINAWLTGRCVIDPANAVMTGMLSQADCKWYGPALSALGLNETRLAEIAPAGELIGTLTPAAAAELGLPESVRVYNGVHDQCACAIGSGVMHAGDTMLSCGTAWVLFAALQGRLQSECACLTPSFHAISGLRSAFYALSAGSQVLNWVCMQAKLTLDEVNHTAASRIKKNENLFCYPYFAGAAGLDAPAPAQGVLSGLDFATDAYDLALAAMESIVFEIARALSVFRACDIPLKQIRMLGGAAKSDLWARILASATGLPVVRPAVREAALLGAVSIAMVGNGAFSDYMSAYAAFAGEESILQPEPELRLFYSKKMTNYLARHASVLALGNSL